MPKRARFITRASHVNLNYSVHGKKPENLIFLPVITMAMRISHLLLKNVTEWQPFAISTLLKVRTSMANYKPLMISIC